MSDPTAAYAEVHLAHRIVDVSTQDTYGNDIERTGCEGCMWQVDANEDPDWIEQQFAEHVARALVASPATRTMQADVLRAAADAIRVSDHDCFKSWCPHCADRKTRESLRADLRCRAAATEGTSDD